MEKWSEIPYVQAFMVLYQNPALYDSRNLKPGEREISSAILDDPLLGSPVSRGEYGAPPAPDSIPTSPKPSTSSEPPSPESPVSPGPFDQSQIPPPLFPPILFVTQRNRDEYFGINSQWSLLSLMTWEIMPF